MRGARIHRACIHTFLLRKQRNLLRELTQHGGVQAALRGSQSAGYGPIAKELPQKYLARLGALNGRGVRQRALLR